MTSVNGVLGPPPTFDAANNPLTLSAKRKREDSTEAQSRPNGRSSSATIPLDLSNTIQDLLDVLKIHDPSPSILTRTLSTSIASSEPQAKRQKGESRTEASTILSRQSNYTSLAEVVGDIDSAVSDILENLAVSSNVAVVSEQNDTSLKVKAFKKRAHELVQKEEASMQQRKEAVTNDGKTSVHSTNSVTHIQSEDAGEGRVALTLFGHAPQPKQLFSSLQLSKKIAGESQVVLQALREAGLPNGINTTHIVPIQSSGIVDEKKRHVTLGELFPSPSTVLQLQPPKPSKTAITRSLTVGWYQPTFADSPRSGTYSKQPVAVGHWLDYSNASPSSNNKKRQRERAMSLGGSKAPQVDAESAGSEATKLDALFKSAYTGFAPSKDDAAAVIPENFISRIWWQRHGEKSFERLVENASKLEDATSTEQIDPALLEDSNEEDNFRAAVEFFEAEENKPSLETKTEKSSEEKDADEVLQGISDLLETLNSYQRIRHMSLSSSIRPAGHLPTSDTPFAGTPSKPGDAEFSTYEILKSQLTIMISSLPPFAVAKLNADRLTELGINTKIAIQTENYQGVMEEDEVSARAKAAAMSAASAASRSAQPATAQRTGATPAAYGNQYGNRPAVAAPPQYYGTQTPVRPPMSSVPRPPATAPVPYAVQRPSSTYRTPSFGTPTYSHQAPRPGQQYAPSQQPYHANTPAQGYSQSSAQAFQNRPPSSSQGSMPQRYPSQPSYSQQTSQNGIGYGYANGMNPRQPSPQKPMYSSPAPAYPQNRPQYSSTPPAMPQDRRSYLQNPMMQNHQPHLMNGNLPQSPQTSHSQQPYAGPPNYPTYMSSEQQASMMERQRAQLAQQQHSAQQQVRQTAQSSAMGSPSKPPVNAVSAGL